MCHCFYDFGGSCPLKRSKISVGPKPIPKNKILSFATPPSLSPVPPPPHNRSSSFLTDGATFHKPRCPHLLGHGCKIPGCINEGPRNRRGSKSAGMKMELTGVNWVVAAAGFLLIWASGGSAAPLECHFDSRAVCEFQGKQYSLGETWMDDACMQCTCLHPVGVGCCETVHRPVDFPAWCEVRVEPVTCRVVLVQSADPRLLCSPGEMNRDPSHGSLQLQQQLEG